NSAMQSKERPMAWSRWQPVGVVALNVFSPVGAGGRNVLECYGVSDPGGSTDPDAPGSPVYDSRLDGNPLFGDGWDDGGTLGRNRRVRPRLAVAVESDSGRRHVFAADVDQGRVYTIVGAGGPGPFSGSWGALPGRQDTDDWHTERGPAAAWEGDALY